MIRQVTEIQVRASCPHCGFDVNVLARLTEKGVPEINPDGAPEDGFHDDERAYVVASGCQSCGQPFAVPTALVQDAQHACLVLLGED